MVIMIKYYQYNNEYNSPVSNAHKNVGKDIVYVVYVYIQHTYTEKKNH